MPSKSVDDATTAGLWLLWVGVGLGAFLASLNYHWIISQSVMLSFISVWCLQNLNPKLVVRGVLFTMAEVFFKDFDVAGQMRVPDEGPIILACAPHANQFVDPIVVTKAISSRKDIGFLAAASTMRKPYIGAIAKIAQSIGVERPQDLASTGTGTLEIEPASLVVKGNGTQFTTFMKPGDLLIISKGEMKGCSSRVTSIESDAVLRLSRPMSWPVLATKSGPLTERVNAASYKIHPLLDQSAVFDSVHDRLNEGSVVGIFPEGGSHDRTELLPIKSGVSQMALGAMAKYPNLISQLKIIPVGINYFKGHRFRSRVFVDIGEPIIPSPTLVEQYKKGGQDRKDASSKLLRQVASGIAGVTVEARDFDHLQFLRAVRRLYKTSTHKASPQERMALMLAFSKGYKRDEGKKEVIELYDNVLEYRNRLTRTGISDHEVSRSQPRDTLMSTATAVFSLLKLLLYLFVCMCVLLPGFIVILPWRFLTRFISKKKAAEALRKSSVKMKGNDVLATWKLMTSVCMLPIQHVMYTSIAFWWGGESWGVGYFFFAPFVAILTIKFSESWLKLFNEFRPLWLALFGRASASVLIEQRNTLKKNVRDIVSKFEWDSNLEKNLGTRAVRRLSVASNGSSTDFDNDLAFSGLVPSDDEDD